MSGFPQSQLPGSVRPAVEVSVDASSVIATLGYFPAAMVRALHVRFIDLLSHHRRSVAKHHKFPAKRRAQRMLFARLSAVYATQRKPTDIDHLVGRSFSRPAREEPFPQDIAAMWETGADVNASAPFVIPLGFGLTTGGLHGMTGFARGAKTSKLFNEVFRQGGAHTDRELHFVRTSSGRVLAVVETVAKRTTSRKNRKTGVVTQTGGMRSQVVGVLARRRRQGPMIEFYGQFDRVLPKHQAKMDADLEMALTEAGRAKLEAKLDKELGLRGGPSGKVLGERKRELRSNLFKSGPAISDAVSRSVAAAAERAARRTMEPKGGGA